MVDYQMCVRVSVITIFHNEERFLADSIASVQSQTFDAWELILVDDASTDASSSIAAQFAEADERIRLVSASNPGLPIGMSAARNCGLSVATGEFIAFLDADDIWFSQKLTQQVEIMDIYPEVAATYGRTEIWHSWRSQGTVTPDHFYELGVEPNCVYYPGTLFASLLKNKVQTPTTCNVIYRREFFDRYGGFDSRFTGMYEDQIAYFKLFIHCAVYVSSAVWARYRQHDESVSAKLGESEGYAESRVALMSWLWEYLRVVGARQSLKFRLALAAEQIRLTTSNALRKMPGSSR